MGVDRLDWMRSRDAYLKYCEWSMDENDSAPMAMNLFVPGLKRHCGFVLRSLRDRDTGGISRIILTRDSYAIIENRFHVRRCPEERLSWDRYEEVSRQRIEAFLEHPKDTWEGWTYPEMYEVYTRTFGTNGMVPLPYSRFKYLFSRMWSERGGDTVVTSRGGRTVRVLRGPLMSA